LKEVIRDDLNNCEFAFKIGGSCSMGVAVAREDRVGWVERLLARIV